MRRTVPAKNDSKLHNSSDTLPQIQENVESKLSFIVKSVFIPTRVQLVVYLSLETRADLGTAHSRENLTRRHWFQRPRQFQKDRATLFRVSDQTGTATSGHSGQARTAIIGGGSVAPRWFARSWLTNYILVTGNGASLNDNFPYNMHKYIFTRKTQEVNKQEMDRETEGAHSDTGAIDMMYTYTDLTFPVLLRRV